MTDGIKPRDNRPCYDITLAGHLDDHWSTWFGDVTIIHGGDDTTTLRGTVADQAELHGLLAKVRDLGATLISLGPVDTIRHQRPRCQELAPGDTTPDS
jgi:exonuclease III